MINKPMVGVAALVVVVAGGGWYYLHSRNSSLPRVPSAAQPAPAPAPVGEPAIAHPLPAAQGDSASQAPLPALEDSDAALGGALAEVAGAAALKDYLMPENMIRRMVVTIDNLPRQKVAVDKRPTRSLAGSFIAAGDELHATLDQRNFQRYQPLVAVIQSIDMRKLAAVYIHFYPLFQRTYQDLGYPNGYFNDRLVQVIDVLLAAPQPAAPALIRPNVMYTFADPALEKLPAGQKLLIRMGPDNATAIKAKLKELRTLITAAPPQR